MLAKVRKKPFPYAFGAAVTVMGGLTTLKAFITGTWPWMVESASPFAGWLADWLPMIVSGAGFGFGLYWWLRCGQYRDAVRKITRDYYAEWADLWHRLDPDGHGEATARVGTGTADATFANKVFDRYDLPREEVYS